MDRKSLNQLASEKKRLIDINKDKTKPLKERINAKRETMVISHLLNKLKFPKPEEL